MSTRLKSRWIIIFMVVVLCLVYWPVVFMQFTIGSDFTAQTFPWLQFMSDSFHHGIFPYWCPYQNLGYPFYADPQSGLFYPPGLLFSLLPVNINLMQFYFFTHVVLSAIGFWCLLKTLDFDQLIAAVLGLIYAMSGLFIGNASHSIIIQSYCWMPFLLSSYLKLWRTAKNKEVLTTAWFAYLNVSGGYIGINLFLVYVLTAIAVYFVIQNKRQSVFLKNQLKLHLILAMLFLCLSSGWLYSIFTAFPYMNRAESVSIEQALSYPVSPVSLLTSCMGWITLNEGFHFQAEFTMRNVFTGALVLLFAFVGIGVTKPKQRYWLLGLVTIALLLSLGPFTPVRAWAYHHLPLMNISRHTGVIRVFVIMAILIFTAQGLQALLNEEISLKKVVAVISYAALSAGIISVILLYNQVSLPSLTLCFKEIKLIAFLQNASTSTVLLFNLFFVLVFLAAGITVLLFSNKALRYTLPLLLLIEVAVTTHFVFYADLETSKSLHQINSLLYSQPRGFPIPENLKLVEQNQWTPQALQPVIWQANGFYERKIPHDGYNGFILKSAIQFHENKNYWNILEQRRLYFSNNGFIRLIGFSPNSFTVQSKYPGLISLSQFWFPGWKAAACGRVLDVTKDEFGFLQLNMPKGCENACFFFHPKYVFELWCGCMFLFGIFGIGIIVSCSIHKNDLTDGAFRSQFSS